MTPKDQKEKWTDYKIAEMTQDQRDAIEQTVLDQWKDELKFAKTLTDDKWGKCWQTFLTEWFRVVVRAEYWYKWEDYAFYFHWLKCPCHKIPCECQERAKKKQEIKAVTQDYTRTQHGPNFSNLFS